MMWQCNIHPTGSVNLMTVHIWLYWQVTTMYCFWVKRKCPTSIPRSAQSWCLPLYAAVCSALTPYPVSSWQNAWLTMWVNKYMTSLGLTVIVFLWMAKLAWHVQALIGEGLLLSLSAAVISDIISPANRAVVLSLNLCGMSVAYTVGPVASGAAPTRLALGIAASGSLLSAFLLITIVPESISATAKAKVFQI